PQQLLPIHRIRPGTHTGAFHPRIQPRPLHRQQHHRLLPAHKLPMKRPQRIQHQILIDLLVNQPWKPRICSHTPTLEPPPDIHPEPLKTKPSAPPASSAVSVEMAYLVALIGGHTGSSA